MNHPATKWRLRPGYAYRWHPTDPEIVILPAAAEGCEGTTGVHEATARRGFCDGVRVVWIDTPIGTFGQMEHVAAIDGE